MAFKPMNTKTEDSFGRSAVSDAAAEEALLAVEEWWLREGMHSFGGAPACIFMVRQVLAEWNHGSPIAWRREVDPGVWMYFADEVCPDDKHDWQPLYT